MTGSSTSQVSRLCGGLDAVSTRFRTRRLEGAYPSVWLDATFVNARQDGKVVSVAVVIAVGVRTSSDREVLGSEVGPSEDGACWLAFLRGLVARGLGGVPLAMRDAHQGLKTAIAAVLGGASWQRCRVQFVRNALALVPKGMPPPVASSIRTVFAQADALAAREPWRRVADGFRDRFPRLATLLAAAAAAGRADRAFPPAHGRQIWSTPPRERLNKEVQRRSDVGGIFPNAAAVSRLVGAILSEQHDAWQAERRSCSAESLAKLTPAARAPLPALPAAS